MKLKETLLLFLGLGFLLIGGHQTTYYGFFASYYLFSFAIASLLGFLYLRGKRLEQEKTNNKK